MYTVVEIFLRDIGARLLPTSYLYLRAVTIDSHIHVVNREQAARREYFIVNTDTWWCERSFSVAFLLIETPALLSQVALGTAGTVGLARSRDGRPPGWQPTSDRAPGRAPARRLAKRPAALRLALSGWRGVPSIRRPREPRHRCRALCFKNTRE